MKHVYSTEGGKRYEFPTHVNELVIDRSDATVSEVFMVEVEPGKGPPPHIHSDAEQVYYIVEGRGTLTVGEGGDARHFPVKPGELGSFLRLPKRATRHTSFTGKYLRPNDCLRIGFVPSTRLTAAGPALTASAVAYGTKRVPVPPFFWVHAIAKNAINPPFPIVPQLSIHNSTLHS